MDRQVLPDLVYRQDSSYSSGLIDRHSLSRFVLSNTNLHLYTFVVICVPQHIQYVEANDAVLFSTMYEHQVAAKGRVHIEGNGLTAAEREVYSNLWLPCSDLRRSIAANLFAQR